MRDILQSIANRNNFGKYVLEVVSWENDADHYQTNIYITGDKEKLTLVTSMLDILVDVPLESGDNSKKFHLFGTDFSSIEELVELDSNAQAHEDDVGVYVGGLFGNEIYMDLYIDLVGGYQYECGVVRQLESYNTYKLSDIGVLEEI